MSAACLSWNKFARFTRQFCKESVPYIPWHGLKHSLTRVCDSSLHHFPGSRILIIQENLSASVPLNGPTKIRPDVQRPNLNPLKYWTCIRPEVQTRAYTHPYVLSGRFFLFSYLVFFAIFIRDTNFFFIFESNEILAEGKRKWCVCVIIGKLLESFYTVGINGEFRMMDNFGRDKNMGNIIIL